MTKHLKSHCLFILLVCLALVSVGANAQNVTRGITPEDYYAFEFVSDPQISPDGKLVAYVVTKVDRAQNRRNSSVRMAATRWQSRSVEVYDQPAIFQLTSLEPGWKIASVSLFAPGRSRTS